jgi:hypothetical protein
MAIPTTPGFNNISAYTTAAGWNPTSFPSPKVQNLAANFTPSESALASYLNNAPSATTQPWNFTVAPEDISWAMNAEVDRVKIFGTNSPPVTSGTRGMRDLSLTNCLLEGFSRGVAVEDQVIALESLLNYSLNTSKGFINIPVYHLKANNKSYGDANGNDGGFYVIKDIKVKESMRDLSGNSTRVNVDVSFTQVPQYQVDSGRDQASQAVTGSKAAFPEQVAGDNLTPKQTKPAGKKGQGKATSGPNAGAPGGTGAAADAAAGGGATGGNTGSPTGSSLQQSYAARYAAERGQ